MKMYSKKELSEFKAIIDHQISEKETMIESLKSSLESTNENRSTAKLWDAQESSDATEVEQILSSLSNVVNHRRRLEMALIRIANGTYGICKTTGEKIPRERLMAHPCATEIVSVKNERNANA